MTRDDKLKLALVKMLPDRLFVSDGSGIMWKIDFARPEYRFEVNETEWLHVCWLVEQELINKDFHGAYYQFCLEIQRRDANQSASWQQRAEALCKVKGITP